MARDGIEPPTHGASIHCSTNWATEPTLKLNCGSRIWTYDLRVMSPTSYLAAPSRDNNINSKEDVGFEPTHAFTRLTVFKTVPFSQTWVILHIYNYYYQVSKGIWTLDPEVAAQSLNHLAILTLYIYSTPQEGFEPSKPGFKVRWLYHFVYCGLI